MAQLRKVMETTEDLCRKCRNAAKKMGPLNDNRNLLMNAAYAVEQLTERIGGLVARNNQLEEELLQYRRTH